MKNIYTLFVALIITCSLMAQAPQSFKYQAVARDASGEVIANQQVSFQISILQDSESGTAVYSETHVDSTNQFGLVTLEIGTGTTTDNFAGIDWSNNAYFIQIEMDATGGTTYTLMGTSQLLSVPYALHARTVENVNVPIYTTTEIAALTPEEGAAVYNNTESLYQIYNGSSWVSFSASCWPQPTTANAGDDQYFTNTTTTVTLSANTQETNHGAGIWSIISGEGGSFADVNNQGTTFTGNSCTDYILRWTITTSCGGSTDEITVSFNQTPTSADAGDDQILNDGSTTSTLAANTPEAEHGTGKWSIVSGIGGSFTDATDPNTSFTGQLHETYSLHWTISTNCSTSEDEVIIIFWQDGAGTPVTDVDGNSYNTVYIGSQLWMAENLKTTTCNDGIAIALVTDTTVWGNSTTPGYCWYGNDSATYSNPYGALYNWYTVETGNLCPTGWHVSSDAELTILTDYLGGTNVAGGKLKETGTTHWNSPNTGATNKSGFTALPGGYRFSTGLFYNIGTYGYWWSSTEYLSSEAWYWYMHCNHSSVFGTNDGRVIGFSVRCVKDN